MKAVAGAGTMGPVPMLLARGARQGGLEPGARNTRRGFEIARSSLISCFSAEQRVQRRASSGVRGVPAARLPAQLDSSQVQVPRSYGAETPLRHPRAVCQAPSLVPVARGGACLRGAVQVTFFL